MRARFFRTIGEIRVPKFVYEPGALRESLEAGKMSMTVAVIERNDGAIVLVDSGRCPTCRKSLARTRGRWLEWCAIGRPTQSRQHSSSVKTGSRCWSWLQRSIVPRPNKGTSLLGRRGALGMALQQCEWGVGHPA